MIPLDLDAWRSGICASDLPPLTRLVCLVASTMADGLGVVRSDKRSLSDRTGLSRRTVVAHLRRAAAGSFVSFDPAPAGALVVILHRIETAVDEAPSAAAHVIDAGDPRWEAWLAYWISQPSRSELARTTRRQRASIEVDADWPPSSPLVPDDPPLGLFRLPWGTPEYAAWLQHWRRTGRARQAQSADVGRHPISEKRRWPPLAALEEVAP